MKSLFTIAILSLATFAAGCSTKTADVGESDVASLEEHEGPYVGDFKATNATDEIQILSLKDDSSFRGLIAKTALGEGEGCVLQPCVSEVSGKWSIATATGAKAKLVLLPTGKNEIRYDLGDAPTDGLKLSRGASEFTLTRFIDCPQVPSTDLTCEGDTVATYDKNGCFAGLSCVTVVPPAICEAIVDDGTATCEGTWKATYSAAGCYTGRTCVPTAPPVP